MPRKKKNEGVAAPAEMQPSTKNATRRAVGKLLERMDAGEERIVLNVKSTGPRSTCREPMEGMSKSQLEIRLADAFGTTSSEFIDAMMVNLLTYFEAPDDRRASREINSALAVLDGIKPENEVEAMLLTQMVATNDAAMKCLSQIRSVATAEAFGNLSVKLLRTFTSQTEALAKLRRKGEQTVRVVHVHPGGQAVVGDVHHHKGTGGRGLPSESEGQSDAAGNFSEGKALPGPDPIGETVPVPRRRRSQKVQDARRD